MSWKLEDEDEDEDEVAAGRMWDISARARSLFVLEMVIVDAKVGGQGRTVHTFTGRRVHCLMLTWVLPREERV